MMSYTKTVLKQILTKNEPVVAATKAIKRGRRPLSDEVKATRAQEKLDAIQVAKRAKIAKKQNK